MTAPQPRQEDPRKGVAFWGCLLVCILFFLLGLIGVVLAIGSAIRGEELWVVFFVLVVTAISGYAVYALIRAPRPAKPPKPPKQRNDPLDDWFEGVSEFWGALALFVPLMALILGGMALGALILYGLVVIIFRAAFGLELPNPFDLFLG